MDVVTRLAPSLEDERFQAFSDQHWVLLAIFVLGLVPFAWWGRRHRGTDRELPARRGFAVVVAALGLTMQIYQFTPDDFALGTSLPLQLCDVAIVSSVIALWTRSPRAAAFTYYVGLTLTVQTVITPSLAETFPHPRFFGFWALHFAVIWAAVYLTWGLGLRPTWALYRFACLATLTWAVSVFAVNLTLGTNYGYLNRKPPSATVLDLLGPWPWYVAAEVVIITVVWAVLLTLPWRPGSRAEGPTEQAPAPGPPRQPHRSPSR